MTIPREVLAITLVIVAVVGSGCDVVGPSACTLIGCTGLVVEVTGAPGQTPGASARNIRRLVPMTPWSCPQSAHPSA